MTSFQLQRNSSLISNGWTIATNSVSIANGLNHVNLSATNQQNFYRLQSQ
jgi:hypothetical protein